MEFWGRKGKEDRQRVPHDARTLTTKGEDDQECLFDFGRERSTTRIGDQQLHLHESPTKDNRKNKRKTKGISSTLTGQTRERMKKKKNRERELGLGFGVKGRDAPELLVLRL